MVKRKTKMKARPPAKHTKLLESVNKFIETDLADGLYSEARNVKRSAKLLSRQKKRQAQLLRQIARQLDVDLGQHEEHHLRAIEAQRAFVETEKERLQKAAPRRKKIQHRQRAAVNRLSELYNRRVKNPGLFVCLSDAADHHSASEVIGATSASASFETESWNNPLQLSLTSYANGSLSRDDWVNFIWDSPTDNGVANISGWVDLYGAVSVIAGSNPCLKAGSAALSFSLWMRVSQAGNQGLTYFPEKLVNVIPWRNVAEGDSFYRSLNSGESVDYHRDVPILAGHPVVISVGLRWRVLLLYDHGEAGLDLSSKSFEAQFGTVYLSHRS